MPCEKHGPRAMFSTAWETMIKSYSREEKTTTGQGTLMIDPEYGLIDDTEQTDNY